MGENVLIRDELREVLDEARRGNKPLGRMVMHRLTLVSLWILRSYVVVMTLLIGLKFLQMAGIVG